MLVSRPLLFTFCSILSKTRNALDSNVDSNKIIVSDKILGLSRLGLGQGSFYMLVNA